MISLHVLNILASVPPAYNAVEKWGHARKGLFSPTDWLVTIGTLVLLGGAIWGILYFQRRLKAKQQWEVFSEQVVKNGLSDDERRTMELLAEEGHVENAALLFERGPFEQAIENAKASEEFAALEKNAQHAMLATLGRVREKLGFTSQRISSQPTTRQLATGCTVEVLYSLDHDPVEVPLVGNTDKRLILEPESFLPVRDDSMVMVRYAHEDIVWEFDTRVLGYLEGKLYLDHSENVRSLNRRRFPRIPVKMPARIARLPFLATGPEGSLQFEQAMVLEIGGPGMVVVSTTPLKKEERVLVAVQVDEDETIEGVGKVLRVSAQEEDPKVMFVTELMGLNDEEIAELCRITNRAARASRASQAQANQQADFRQDETTHASPQEQAGE